MNNNLEKTKRNLTIIFTVIVFLVIFLLEVIFFSTKYYRETNKAKNNFVNITTSIEKKFTSLKQFIAITNVWKKIFEKRSKLNWNTDKIPKRNNLWYIVINKNNKKVIFFDFNSSIDDLHKLEELVFDDDFYWILQYWWFLINKISITEDHIEYDIIFLNKLKYNFDDYINDLISFILATLLFSTLLYYIWYKFVNETFKPVEENFKDMKNFIHNAGHELKTPISVIHSNIQLIDDVKIYDKK